MLNEKETRSLDTLRELFPKLTEAEKIRFQYILEGMKLVVDRREQQSA